MMLTFADLAWRANAGRRRAFYPTKDRILRLFGKPDGFDLQLFECWGCEGCRSHEDDLTPYRDSCGGTLVHHYFILDRFRLGARIFHRPTRRRLPSWPRLDIPEATNGERNRIAGRTLGGVDSGSVAREESDRAAGWLMMIFGPNRSAGYRILWPQKPKPIERDYWAVPGFTGWEADPEEDDIPF